MNVSCIDLAIFRNLDCNPGVLKQVIVHRIDDLPKKFHAVLLQSNFSRNEICYMFLFYFNKIREAAYFEQEALSLYSPC